jgi:riboflavin biosynthesis pyrimidine reductase
VADFIAFLESQNRLDGVRANFIVNERAEFVDESGSSKGLSNAADRSVLIKLRSLSDLIITDAATARAEHYKPSKYAPIQIWSRTGNFRGIQLQDGLSGVTTHDVVKQIEHEKKTHRSILLETGPNLTRFLGKEQAIDGVNLTVIGARSLAGAKSAQSKAIEQLQLDYLHLVGVFEYQGNYFFSSTR